VIHSFKTSWNQEHTFLFCTENVVLVILCVLCWKYRSMTANWALLVSENKFLYFTWTPYCCYHPTEMISFGHKPPNQHQITCSH